MAKVGFLEIDLVTNIGQFVDDMGKAARTAEQTAKRINAIADAVQASFSALGAGFAINKMIESAGHAELAMKKVESVITSTGGAAGITAKQVNALSNELSKQTGVDNNLINETQALMLTFTKIGKDIMPEATKAVLDMSAVMGRGLHASALEVGKALNDPIKGLTALTRAGASFTDSQKETIKSLVESGRMLEAQKFILHELQMEFGGAASAVRNTLIGAFEQLKMRIDNLMQQFGIGSGDGLRAAIEGTILLVDQLTERASSLAPALQGVAAAAATIISLGLGQKIREIAIALVAFVSRMNPVAIAISAVIGLLVTFRDEQAALIGSTRTWGEVVSDVAQTIYSVFRPLFNFLIAGIRTIGDDFSRTALNVQKMFRGEWNKLDGTAALSTFGKNSIDYMAGVEQYVNKMRKQIADVMSARPGHVPIVHEEGAGSAASEAAAKKARQEAEHLAKQTDEQRKRLAEMVESARRETQLVQERLAGNEANAAALRAGAEVQKLTLLTEQERSAALKAITAEIQKQTQMQSLGKVKQMTEELQRQLEIEKLKLAGREQEQALLRDIEKINKLDGLTLDQKKSAVDQVTEAYRQLWQVQDLEKAKQLVDNFQKQNEKLRAQIGGYEDLLPLLEAEQKIRKMTNLSIDQQEQMIRKVRDLAAEERQLNKQLHDQKALIDRIVDSQHSFNRKVEELRTAYQAGTINQKQYEDALERIQKQHEKVGETFKKYAGVLTKGFSDAITGGKKFTDVLKDMGNQLASMLAQDLFLNPLQNMISNVAQGLFGFGGGSALSGIGFPSALAGAGGGLGGLLGGLLGGGGGSYAVGGSTGGLTVSGGGTLGGGMSIAGWSQYPNSPGWMVNNSTGQMMQTGDLLKMLQSQGTGQITISGPQKTILQPDGSALNQIAKAIEIAKIRSYAATDRPETQANYQNMIAQMQAQPDSFYAGWARELLVDPKKTIGLLRAYGIESQINQGYVNWFAHAAGEFARGGRPPVGLPSIVGERGPELFVPDTAGRVIPNDILAGGGSGGTNVTINNNSGLPIEASAVQTNGNNVQITIESLVAKALKEPGLLRKTLNRQGVRPAPRRS